MQYIGIQSQIRRNNTLSVLLLFAFPSIILCLLWVFFAIINWLGNDSEYGPAVDFYDVNSLFLATAPWVILGVAIWFVIAYFFNAQMVRMATGAHPLERRENKRVYNLVENLCIAVGMKMPKVYVVNDSQLNAYASGIDDRSYAVTLTTGIIDRLDDLELEGVIAHELTHIRNRDTRLLITSIVFVGIVSTLLTLLYRLFRVVLWDGSGSRRSNFSSNRNDKGNGVAIIVAIIVGLICMAIAYLFMSLTRFAISRKREYMADAGGAELTRNPLALASALRKISGDPGLRDCGREDIAQLFIVHPQSLSDKSMFTTMFSTHPDIRKRIEILEQF